MSRPDAEQESPAARFVGEGFHVEPDFRVEPDYRTESGASVYDPTDVPVAGSGFGTSGAGAPDNAESSAGSPGRTSALALPAAPESAVGATELNNAFDDPLHGEPGKDRLAVHAIWEILLLIAVAAMVFVVNQNSRLHSDDVRGLLVLAAVYTALAAGAGLSLRAGAVNLAVGPIMVGSALFFAQQYTHHSFYVAAGLAIALATGIGAAIAVVVTMLHVPGWAVSLAAFLGVDVWIAHLPAKVGVSGAPDIASHAYYVFAAVAVLAIVCATIGAVRPVRRAIGRYRPVSDPADRRGPAAAWIAAIFIVLSSSLAAVAGVLNAKTTGSAVTDNGLIWTAAAIGIALVGGTSAFGRRGGIFGTVLAASLFVLVTDYQGLANWRIDPLLIAGGALLLGVIVTRLVETLGRPQGLYGGEVSTTRWLGGGRRWSDDSTTQTIPASGENADRASADWGESESNPWGAR